MRQNESLFSYWMARISLSWPVRCQGIGQNLNHRSEPFLDSFISVIGKVSQLLRQPIRAWPG
jgi:hypothetical protein